MFPSHKNKQSNLCPEIDKLETPPRGDGDGSDAAWHTLTLRFILTLCFIMQQVETGWKKKRQRERESKEEEVREGRCNISVRLAVDVLEHERVLRCTEAEAWRKIVNTAGFQRGWFRAGYSFSLFIYFDLSETEREQLKQDVCGVKRLRRKQIQPLIDVDFVSWWSFVVLDIIAHISTSLCWSEKCS